MIKLPIKVGDTILGGKFKNVKVVVKTIDKNEKGDITINGKPLLRFRIPDKDITSEQTIIQFTDVLQEAFADEENKPGTFQFYHGGNLDHYDDVIAQKNGRFEYGAGLYLTSSAEIARKYAKGGRKLYLITVEKGTEIHDVRIPMNYVHAFLKAFVQKKKQPELLQYMEKRIVDDTVPASTFNNLILNLKCIRATNTKDLRSFLVGHGIDYNIVDNAFGSHDKLMVLYNMKKIVDVKILKPGDHYEEELENHYA